MEQVAEQSWNWYCFPFQLLCILRYRLHTLGSLKTVWPFTKTLSQTKNLTIWTAEKHLSPLTNSTQMTCWCFAFCFQFQLSSWSHHVCGLTCSCSTFPSVVDNPYIQCMYGCSLHGLSFQFPSLLFLSLFLSGAIYHKLLLLQCLNLVAQVL